MQNKIRKVFTVIIHKKEYDVYDIEGKEHNGYNDTIKTWWVYYSDRLPGNLIPPTDSPDFVPYSSQINRRLWDIRFKQNNSSKYKWDEVRFSNYTNVEMYCNDKLIYEFGTTGNNDGLSFAMAKVQYLKVMLSEHPYNFFEPEKENGRKICWYGLPATIEVKAQTWEVKIIPDYTAGLTKDEWWAELSRREHKFTKNSDDDLDDIELDNEYRQEDIESGYINWGDALSDDHIYWFRK